MAPARLVDAGVAEGDHQLFEERRRGRGFGNAARGGLLAERPEDLGHGVLDGTVNREEQQLFAQEPPGRDPAAAAQHGQDPVLGVLLPGLPRPSRFALDPFGFVRRRGPEQEQAARALHLPFEVAQAVSGAEPEHVLPDRDAAILQGPPQRLGLRLVRLGVGEEELAGHR